MTKLVTILVILNLYYIQVFSQDFKFIKPILSDSTKVVKTEIDKKNQFERIYYIDYSRNSRFKEAVIDFGATNIGYEESISYTYFGVLKNLKSIPKKIKTKLPDRWIKLFKYNQGWILFNDIPKYILSDSCLATFYMDDPVSSVIKAYKLENGIHEYELLAYNWENPVENLKCNLKIKVLDPKNLISLWKFEYQGQVAYDLLVPANSVLNFPVMVMMETDLMDDETDIFDKIDFEKLWNK